jgi:hypothetical protein
VVRTLVDKAERWWLQAASVDLLVVLLVNLVVLVDPVDKFQSLLLTWY